MKLRNIGIILLLIGIFAFLTVCDKEADTKGIELNVTLLPQTITDFLYVKMNYGSGHYHYDPIMVGSFREDDTNKDNIK